MKKLLIGIVLLPFLTGCGHPVAVGLALWFSQPKKEKVVVVSGPGPLTITTTSLPCAINGVDYNETVAATGGETPYTWGITAGALPSPIALDSATGLLWGNPSDTTGDFTFTVEVTDSATPPATATQDLTISLYDQLQMSDPSPLAFAINSTDYIPATVTATGGTGTYTWSISAGALPTGLSVDVSTGVLSGNPSDTAGSYSFTVTVQDDAVPPQTVSLPLTLDLYGSVTITSTSLPDPVVNVLYSFQVETTGSSGDLAWSLSGAPASLSIDAATGIISGTPPLGHAGSYTFTVDVTDNVTGLSDSRDYPVDVVIILQISTVSLPDSYVGETYNQTLTAINGVPAYTWSGTLPSGLSLATDTGVISGAPDAGGDYTFTITVTDSDTTPATDSKDFTIHIYDDLLITTATLPDGEVGTLYSVPVSYTGGSTDLTWSLSGAPASITIDTATGATSGTPVLGEEGSHTFAVTVTDNVTGDSDSQNFPVDITLVLYITTASLPDSYVNDTYNQTMSAAGGTTPYIWSLSGTLPSGLSIATDTGAITGTSDTGGDYTFTITVTDSDTTPATDSADFTISIYEELLITTTSPLPYAINNVAYSETLSATGGTGPYTWSEIGGALPTGLSLNSGVIEGTPSAAAGAFSVTVQVDDSGTPAQTDTLPLNIELYDLLQITTSSPLPGGNLGAAYSETLAAAGGTGTYTWSEVTSELATYGLMLNADGSITGNPSLAGTCTFTAEVQDDESPAQTAQAVFSITVLDVLIVDFTAAPTTGIAPLDVSFTDASTGNVTAWEWDFDNDGTVDATVQDTSYTYTNPGWYTVKLTISNATDTDTITKEKHILVYEAIWYVDDTGGNDTNGGLSWGDAFATIQTGLDAAIAAPVANFRLVLVADGTYVGADNKNLDFAGQDIYLKAEDYNSTATWIIDCQNGGRGFNFATAEGADSVVDGFTIQNGRVNPGGGIACNGASPTIINCTIDSNQSTAAGGDNGGGIALNNASPTIINCTISNNDTGGGGGDAGGGIFCTGAASNPTITDCTITGNTAGGYGGAILCLAGSSPTITDCTITGNTADDDGGGILCNNSSLTITNCTIDNNSTVIADGGGVFCENGASLQITSCIVTNNEAGAFGGGIYCTGTASAAIANCLIANNSTGTSGGDLGGGVCCDLGADATIADCTIANNTADYGGGLYCRNNFGNGAVVTVDNTIFWGNTATTGNQIRVLGFGSAVTLNYCDYADGANDVAVAVPATFTPDANCITSDPVFVDAGVAGVGGGGDYHLQGTSLCIDVGDDTAIPGGVTTDLDGNVRILGLAVDMGAYEYVQ